MCGLRRRALWLFARDPSTSITFVGPAKSSNLEAVRILPKANRADSSVLFGPRFTARFILELPPFTPLFAQGLFVGRPERRQRAEVS